MVATMEQLLAAAGAHTQEVQRPRECITSAITKELTELETLIKQAGIHPGALIVSCPFKLLPAVMIYCMAQGASETAITARLAERIGVEPADPYVPGWSLPVQITCGDVAIMGLILIDRLTKNRDKVLHLTSRTGNRIVTQEMVVPSERLHELETKRGSVLILTQPHRKLTITNPVL